MPAERIGLDEAVRPARGAGAIWGELGEWSVTAAEAADVVAVVVMEEEEEEEERARRRGRRGVAGRVGVALVRGDDHDRPDRLAGEADGLEDVDRAEHVDLERQRRLAQRQADHRLGRQVQHDLRARQADGLVHGRPRRGRRSPARRPCARRHRASAYSEGVVGGPPGPGR